MSLTALTNDYSFHGVPSEYVYIAYAGLQSINNNDKSLYTLWKNEINKKAMLWARQLLKISEHKDGYHGGR